MKIIDVPVVASDADKKAAEADIADATSKLTAAASNTAAGNVVRQASSLLPFSDVYKTKEAFPSMISAALDSTAVGSVKSAAFDPMTNTYYTYKVLGKTTQPDSVLFRQIGVIGKDEVDIAKKADSIMTALNGGAKFKDIAKSEEDVLSLALFPQVAPKFIANRDNPVAAPDAAPASKADPNAVRELYVEYKF